MFLPIYIQTSVKHRLTRSVDRTKQLSPPPSRPSHPSSRVSKTSAGTAAHTSLQYAASSSSLESCTRCCPSNGPSSVPCLSSRLVPPFAVRAPTPLRLSSVAPLRVLAARAFSQARSSSSPGRSRWRRGQHLQVSLVLCGGSRVLQALYWEARLQVRSPVASCCPKQRETDFN